MPKPNSNNVTLSIKLEREYFDKVKELASKKFLPTSTFAKMVLLENIDKYDTEKH